MNSDGFNHVKTSANVDFGNPPRVVFGLGTAQTNLSHVVKEIESKKIVLVSDEIVSKTGALEKIESSLKASDLKFEELLIPVGEPTTEMTKELVNNARSEKPDLYIGIGGGSLSFVS